MSFANRLIHRLTIIRTTYDDAEEVRSEYQQPAETIEEIPDVHGLVQPRKAEELPDSRSAGAEISDLVLFLEPITVYPSDAFVWQETGQRLEVDGIRSFLFGRSPHHEVDCHAVTTSPVEVGGS